MAEEIWDSFARLNAAERFKAQSAEMGAAVTEAIVKAAAVGTGEGQESLAAGYAADAAPAAGARTPGMRVLDVACGSGEPSISIAALLQGTGQVVGLDLAETPLEVGI